MIDLAHERQEAQELLNRLTAEQLVAVVHLMRVIAEDPVGKKLSSAPLETEEISAEEEAKARASREWLKHNSPIPNREVLAEFGLTEADFEKMADILSRIG